MYDRIIHKWLRIPYRLHADIVRDPVHPRATLLMIHGIGNNGHAWDDVIAKLPNDLRIITIDLLGFGRSPRPNWIEYSAHEQARSVLHTYLSLGIPDQVIIVGHSLGSLIAVEIAKRYPLLVKSLVLASPPFYRPEDPASKTLLPKPDTMLREIYRSVQKDPEEFVRMASIAMKYKLINNVFEVTADNVSSYMATLETAIVNQTSMDDIEKLTLPITLIHGKLDPVVVPENLVYLSRAMPNITLEHVLLGGHEITTGAMITATVRAIEHSTPSL